ncbi:hypothetical protein [Pseudoalteromonas phage PH357]|nr:hypothetical protein [Pseudoalteromonas phage PH357]
MILREKKTIEVQLQTRDQIKDISGKVDTQATENLIREKVHNTYGAGYVWFTKKDSVNGEYVLDLYVEARV